MGAFPSDWELSVDSDDLDHVLKYTSDFWEEMRGQSLFLTGGTGFFGHWILESFLWVNDRLNLNANITVLSRDPDKFLEKEPGFKARPAINWLQGDVKNFEYPSGEYRYLIHAASEGDSKVARSNPKLVFDTIVQGTSHVLGFAVTHKTKKMLFTSSGAVYGKQPANMSQISEEYLGAPDPMNPVSAYGEAKRAAEMLCRLYNLQYGLETKIARCFAFVGPHLPLDADFAIGNFIRDALKGGPIEIKGDGTPYRSYLYASDLAIWLWTILFKGEPCRPYNVGSDEAISILALAKKVQQIIDPNVEIIVCRQMVSDKEKTKYVPSIQRAYRELSLKKRINLENGLIKTVNLLKKFTSY